jgi:hypothetical protein
MSRLADSSRSIHGPCGQDPARLRGRCCSAVDATTSTGYGTQEVHSDQADQAARRPGCPPTFGDPAASRRARLRSRPRGPVPVSSSGGLRSRLAGFAVSLALSTPRGPRRTASTGPCHAEASTARGDPGRPGTLLRRHQGDQVQLSALRPLCDRPRSPRECSPPEKALAREPVTVTAIPTPQTASQTVKCSLPLLGRTEMRTDQRFRWSDPLWWARQGLNL